MEIAELEGMSDGEITTNCLFKHGVGMTGNKLTNTEKLLLAGYNPQQLMNW